MKAFKELKFKKVSCLNLGKISNREAKRIAVETNETRFNPDNINPDSQANQRRRRLSDSIYHRVSILCIPGNLAAFVSRIDSHQLALAESLVFETDTTDTRRNNCFCVGYMGVADAGLQETCQAEKAGNVRGMALVLVPGKPS